MSDFLVLGASAAVIVFMVAVAAVLGFRIDARLDEAELQRLAASEGARLSEAVLDLSGKAALARLDSGRVLAARVMADGISTRVAATDAVRIKVNGQGVRVAFADIGFPPLVVRLGDQVPGWVLDLERAR
jgi:hypothetical protein